MLCLREKPKACLVEIRLGYTIKHWEALPMHQPLLFPEEDHIGPLLDYHKEHCISDGEFYNVTNDFSGMAVDTGYFAGERSDNMLAITRFTPSWFEGPCWTTLSPSGSLLQAYKSGLMDERSYCRWFYRETLSLLDPISVYKELQNRGMPMLLCFEKNGVFCHRHLVQEWLTLELLKRGLIDKDGPFRIS